MTASTSAHVTALMERAGLLPAPPGMTEQLAAACRAAGCDADAVLELSRARWRSEVDGAGGLVVLLREALVLVRPVRRGLFGRPDAHAALVPLAGYHDLIDDDEFDAPAVFFQPRAPHAPFYLEWDDAAERDRMYRAIFAAHRRRYERWGLRLDPGSYAADFDRFHAEAVADGPAEGLALWGWARGRYGDFEVANALGLAVEWRGCELDDAAGCEPSRRVMRIAHPEPWVDMGEEARRLVVRLGERLYDDGLLGPPFDERSFDTGEPLTATHAGPARLVALMNLAAHAKALVHPRAAEWVEAAQAGIPAVPPTVFSPALRERWAAIAPLPTEQDADRELPIWEDPDVAMIATVDHERHRVSYAMEVLPPADATLVGAFLGADGEDGDEAAAVRSCLLGVRAFEALSAAAPVGWRKLVLYAVSDRTYDLWEARRLAPEAAARLAQWVVATIEANGWGPDGRTTPLGQHHSYAMGVAVRTGIGLLDIDPETGRASAPTGDEARRAAAAGRF